MLPKRAHNFLEGTRRKTKKKERCLSTLWSRAALCAASTTSAIHKGCKLEVKIPEKEKRNVDRKKEGRNKRDQDRRKKEGNREGQTLSLIHI